MDPRKDHAMSDPINSVSYNNVRWDDPQAESSEQHSSLLCGSPKSVLTGMLCGDETAVSNACRKAPPGSVDAYLCDDRKLKDAQDLVNQTVWDILKTLFGRFTKIVK
jgi:hypothetical protein